ncbi:MAG: hypothetical protein ABI877_01300 [Gemmatimonadaceae bacterium]
MKSSALPGELADLVLELALALHKRAIYPATHPLLKGAVESLWRRATRALEGRSIISLGVARTQLIVEGVATEETHPLLRELATHLHEHQLAAMRFLAGVTREEIDDMLAFVAVPAIRVERPLGTLGADALARWRHIALFPASFDKLELAEDDPEAGEDERAFESQQLWVGLARTALAGADESEEGPDDYDPFRVAGAINSHRGERAYEQVVIGYFLQIAHELHRAPNGSRGAERLGGRVSKLIASLSPETLTRLMEMGGDSSQRQEFLRQATDTLSASAVLDLVRASATASAKPISDAMLRLLGKLARNAGGQRKEASNADALLRSQVRSMLEGWTLDDPNPDGYGELLRGIGNSEARSEADVLRDECEPERIIEISLACGTVGASTELAIAEQAKREGLATVLDYLTSLPPGNVREALIDCLLTGAVLTEQLATERPDVRVLEHAVARLRERATEPLLEALARRDECDALWLSDLLRRTGTGGIAIIAVTLMERNVESQRVLLGVLDRADAAPAEADLERLSRSDDAPLRREALRLTIKQPTTRLDGILRALRDRDEKTVAMALNYALRDPTLAVVSALIARLDDGADLNVDLYSRAVRAVAGSGIEDAVQWLTRLVLTQHWLLRYTKLRKSSAKTVAGIAGLAAHWRDHPQAALPLLLAKRSPDAAYRHAARRGGER